MFMTRQHENRTLTWWYARRDRIDIEPSYQRSGGVWRPKDKAFLIDSIINGFDVPKLYFADFTIRDSPLNRKQSLYAVIDGRQRLESIFGFFRNEFPLANDFVYVADPSLQLGGLRYRDLEAYYPKVVEDFNEYNLTVMSVITDEEPKILELFVRLNMGRALTGAEVRNAMPGRIPALVRDLAQHDVFARRIDFNVRRGQDKNSGAKLLLIEFKGRLVDTKKQRLDRFVEQFEGEIKLSTSGARVVAPADEMMDVAPNESETSADASIVSPDDAEQAELLLSADAPAFVAEAELAETQDVEAAAARVRSTLDRMTSVFVERDPLLASEGNVVLFYWLIRNAPEAPPALLKSFLNEFEAERRQQPAIAKTAVDGGGADLDAELLEYNTLRRAINDQGALTRMYEILERRLRAYLSRPTLS